MRLGIECKQYEKSSLAVKSLIHEWDSKNKELEFDQILLILVGCNVNDEHRLLATKYGIKIWDEEKFNRLFSEAIEKRKAIKDMVLLEAGLRPSKEVAEKFEKIKKEYRCDEEQAMKILRGEADQFDKWIMRLVKELGCDWDDAWTFFFLYWDHWIGSLLSEEELEETIDEFITLRNTASFLKRRKINNEIKKLLKVKEYCSELKQLFIEHWVVPKQHGREPELDDFLPKGRALRDKITELLGEGHVLPSPKFYR